MSPLRIAFRQIGSFDVGRGGTPTFGAVGVDQLFNYCQLGKLDVSSPALKMKRLNDGRGCPATGICTRTLLQPALNLVSSFRFENPDFAPPRRAWAELLGGNLKAFLDLESLLHPSCTHPALPHPALCPSWLLQVSGQTPRFRL